jgi:hypothetical protein
MKSLLAAAAIAMPGAVMAENVVATTGDSLARFFENEGIDVEVTTDNTGDPKLRVKYYGNEFSIYYYGCRDNTNCDAIQFFSGYKNEGSVRMSKINEWNTENRFARGYISEAGSARIEHDVYLGKNGMDPDDFATLLSKWSSQVSDFEEFIDW